MSLLDLTLSAAHPVVSVAHPVMSLATSAVDHLLAAATPSAPAGGTGLPDSNPQGPQGLVAPLQRVIGFAKWAALGVCIVALIIWGALVAWSSHRGRGEDLAGGFGKILFGVVTISGGVSVLSFIIG